METTPRPDYKKNNPSSGDERGFVLVVALFFLGILALLGSTAVVVTSTDVKIAGNHRSTVQSYYIAEAGIKEALYRLNLPSSSANAIGQAPGTTPTPGWGRYIVMQTGQNKCMEDPEWNRSTDGLDNDGDITVDETNETYPEVATLQTINGQELSYMVRVRYKLEDAQYNNGLANGDVVLYGQNFGFGSSAPALGTQPVIEIKAIGKTKNNTKRVIIALMRRLPLDINVKGGFSCDASPNLGGNSFISGFNHQSNTTPSHSGSAQIPSILNNTRDNHGGNEPIGHGPGHDNSTNWDSDEEAFEATIPYGAKVVNDATTYLPGVWTTSDVVSPGGSNSVYGGNNLTSWKDETGTGGWWTLAQVLGISQADVQTVLQSADVTMADTVTSGQNIRLNKAPQGLIYINNAGTGKELQITSNTPSNNNGWGLMYITGDLDAQNLTFRGLIYVEGTVKLSGNVWVLGAEAVRGGNPTGQGGATILYSKSALDEQVGAAMKFVIMSLQDDSLT